MMLNRLRLVGLALVLSCAPAWAQDLALKRDHPQRYVVQKGDTLWDIAARFLQEPWRWPEIWRLNPQIQNPHLIHPGDVVELVYEDGRPRLRLAQQSGPKVVKLRPQARRIPLEVAKVSIPMERIRPFFSREGILAPGDLARAGTVVGSDDNRIILGPGDRIYASGLIPGQRHYRVFRPGRVFHAADGETVLGREAINLGEARLEQEGEPASLRIVRARREILPGDRLLPVEGASVVPADLVPHLPSQPMEGRIVDVLEGVSRIGQYQVVVVDVGERDGAEAGLVLDVYQRPGVLVAEAGVVPPEERVGRLMVFRTFDRLSYALVTEALRELRVHDRIAAHP